MWDYEREHGSDHDYSDLHNPLGEEGLREELANQFHMKDHPKEEAIFKFCWGLGSRLDLARYYQATRELYAQVVKLLK